ncbi:MAG: hypothetical protein LDL41_07520 [Coleofasciculus sp. S288]|nr:hypothetical protein [Coleofasciculus sp. S288]
MSKLDVSILDQTNQMFPKFKEHLFVAIVDTGGVTLFEKEVHLESAVIPFDLAPGEYTVVVQHPSTNPPEVKHQVELASENTYVLATFYFDSDGNFLTSVAQTHQF